MTVDEFFEYLSTSGATAELAFSLVEAFDLRDRTRALRTAGARSA